jgi:hypothetical protein
MDYEIAISLDGSPIADGTPEVGQVESLSINGTALVQRAQPIRALSPSFFDRLAKTNTIEFAITREHTDVAESFAWIAARRGATPGVGALSMTLTIGAKTVTISASSAEWGSTQGGCRGVASRVQYTVTTGLLTVAVTGSDTLGPADFWIPTEPLALINPLTIPAGRTAEIAAGRVCFAYSTSISGTLNVDPAGLLQIVP